MARERAVAALERKAAWLAEQGVVEQAARLVLVGGCHPSSNGLQALARARADQASHIERAHTPTGWVMSGVEERFEPGLEFVIPRNRGAHNNLLRTTLQDETLTGLSRFLIPA